jgi:hypothetical protein
VWESWIAAAAWRNETKVRDSRMVGYSETDPAPGELTLGTPGLLLGASGCWRVIL